MEVPEVPEVPVWNMAIPSFPRQDAARALPVVDQHGYTFKRVVRTRHSGVDRTHNHILVSDLVYVGQILDRCL